MIRCIQACLHLFLIIRFCHCVREATRRPTINQASDGFRCNGRYSSPTITNYDLVYRRISASTPTPFRWWPTFCLIQYLYVGNSVESNDDRNANLNIESDWCRFRYPSSIPCVGPIRRRIPEGMLGSWCLATRVPRCASRCTVLFFCNRMPCGWRLQSGIFSCIRLNRDSPVHPSGRHW